MDHEAPLPDYYAILKIPSTATSKQIRDAYKRAALENHPDRVAADSPERKVRTRKFQLANDAYYTLSDAGRRIEYDNKRKLQQRRGGGGGGGGGSSSSKSYGFAEENDADDYASDYPRPGAFPQDKDDATHAGASAGSWRWNPFSSSDSSSGGTQQQQQQTAEEAQFADVFEEMMREEGMAEGSTGQPTHKFWSLLGGVSGGVLGFIVANVPGMVTGAVAGNRLGAIRDVKGMSVYDVFTQLPAVERSRLLGQLAARVLSHAAGV